MDDLSLAGEHGSPSHCCFPKCKQPGEHARTTSLKPGERWYLCDKHFVSVGPDFEVTDEDLSDWEEVNRSRKKVDLPPVTKMTIAEHEEALLKSGVPESWIRRGVSVDDLL